jgi:sialic acid synthase SpsE
MERVYVIAEAEINHNGDIEIAKKMIEAAKECGADCVKFQYIIANEIATPDSSYYELFSKVELSQGQFKELKYLSEEVVGLDFMITVPSIKTFHLARQLGIKKTKIGSSNLTNTLLLRGIAKYKDEHDIYLSTGMANLCDIRLALEALNCEEDDRNFHVFHCSSNYPASYENLNLNAISTLKKVYRNMEIGYSDHTMGSLAAIVSVSLGASLIEKHFTLDKTMDGPDHSFSADPKELRHYILDIRNTEKALGAHEKKPAASELEILKTARRFLVVREHIKKGSQFSPDMLDAKRLGEQEKAVEVRFIDILTNFTAPKDYKPGDIIRWSDFE